LICIVKDFEGSGRDLLTVQSKYIPGKTEESNENLRNGNQYPGRYSNWVLPEYNSRALSLLHSVNEEFVNSGGYRRKRPFILSCMSG
jgi:hypothetical protein